MFKYLASQIVGTANANLSEPPSGVWAFYWYFLRQHKFWYFSVFVTIFFVAMMDLCIPIGIGYITSLLESPNPRQFFNNNILVYAGLATIVLVIRPVVQMFDIGVRLNVISPGITASIRWQSHWHVVRQSWPFFQSDFAGRIANRVMQTGAAFRDSVLSTARSIVYISVYGFSAMTLMLVNNWLLAVPTMIWLILYLSLLRLSIPNLMKLSRGVSEKRSSVMARVVDCYTNILTVKLFSRSADEDQVVKDSIDDCQNAMASHGVALSRFISSLHWLSALLITSTALIGLHLWFQGKVDAALVATAVPLVWQISNISQWVSFEVAGIFENIGIVQEGMESIAVPHDIVDEPGAQSLTVSQGLIEFSDIQFAYKGTEPVFKNLKLSIRPGERVGIIGRSGAGKSTLINLLLRFYNLNSGVIRVDGQDIRNVTQESLRRSIGVVSQDTSLLHRSIADNIRYGESDASDTDVESAARRAHAHDFITGLVDWEGRKGYNAHAGERGVKLSGGQRQRVALARVILKNAPILVLDEATSALDSEIELAIQEQLDSLMENKTVIAIAHRLSTIAHMDRLVVIDDGNIVEQGSHEELLAQQGLYAKLWRHQSGGFLPEHLVLEDEAVSES